MKRHTSVLVALAFVFCGCAASSAYEPMGAGLEGDDAGVAPDASVDAAAEPAPVPSPPPCVGRCVRGVVTTKDGAPAAGQPVLLEDRATLQIRSYLASAAGEYRFVGLLADREYELSAHAADGSSAHATIDGFDDRPDLVIDLRLR